VDGRLQQLLQPLGADARGLDRFIDWDDDLDARVDIGAVELAFDELYA
jgi:hypothetical protein